MIAPFVLGILFLVSMSDVEMFLFRANIFEGQISTAPIARGG
jgi:hypothetical protein